MQRGKVEVLLDRLKEKGEKITAARKGVLEVLAATDQLLNVAEIYEALRVKEVFVNYSTVYRTLDYLLRNQLVEKLTIGGVTRYKLSEYGQHTHHLICKECHSTQPLNYCPYNDLETTIRSSTDFLPVEHRLEIYGYCAKCQEKLNYK